MPIYNKFEGELSSKSSRNHGEFCELGHTRLYESDLLLNERLTRTPTGSETINTSFLLIFFLDSKERLH